MRIIAHRGIWNERIKPNSIEAFMAARAHGFGVETDIRDCAGAICVSHDPPVHVQPSLAQLLEIFQGHALPLAINIKADGLGDAIAAAFAAAGIRDYFVFDMSIPDALGQIAAGNPAYLRRSEYEGESPLQAQCAGIWLDAFTTLWYDAAQLSQLLGRQPVCVVSEELHGRDPAPQWAMLKPFVNHPRLALCTDWPERAREFAGGQI